MRARHPFRPRATDRNTLYPAPFISRANLDSRSEDMGSSPPKVAVLAEPPKPRQHRVIVGVVESCIAVLEVSDVYAATGKSKVYMRFAQAQ